jgi:hypothetical protein
LYQVGGEVAVVQSMFLTAQIDDGFTNRLAYFTSNGGVIERPWPFLQIHLDQTNGTIMQFFRLDLVAAPLREVWFSTTAEFHAGIWQPPTNRVSPGDFLSSAGRIVQRNEDLTARLGLMPGVPDLGLDAVDVLSGGEIAFSIETDVLSETLGPLHHGDLLSNRGRIVARNQDLLHAFGIMPPLPDVGLDAVQVLDSSEILFSIETDIFSGTAGQLRRGDLLSNRGVVIRTHDALLARFHPPPIPHDYGLDAIHLWPSGEIWFSLEEGFQDGTLGPIRAGDLLSDQGFVIYRNLDLVASFSPLEDLADFGLDALFILPGATPLLNATRAGSGLLIEWDAPGAILQEADALTGPWRDLLPLGAPGSYQGTPASGAKFFRLREP